MEIDEHLKYTLYVFTFISWPLMELPLTPNPACNSTPAPEPASPWSPAEHPTTSCNLRRTRKTQPGKERDKQDRREVRKIKTSMRATLKSRDVQDSHGERTTKEKNKFIPKESCFAFLLIPLTSTVCVSRATKGMMLTVQHCVVGQRLAIAVHCKPMGIHCWWARKPYGPFFLFS